MTMFVGCPEGCRYHTASAVYDLVFFEKRECSFLTLPSNVRKSRSRQIVSFDMKLTFNYRVSATGLKDGFNHHHTIAQNASSRNNTTPTVSTSCNSRAVFFGLVFIASRVLICSNQYFRRLSLNRPTKITIRHSTHI